MKRQIINIKDENAVLIQDVNGDLPIVFESGFGRGFLIWDKHSETWSMSLRIGETVVLQDPYSSIRGLIENNPDHTFYVLSSINEMLEWLASED